MLDVTVKVAYREVRHIRAVNMVGRPIDKSQPDSVYPYDYVISTGNLWHARKGERMRVIAEGRVEHRYGDGALALLKKVLDHADLSEDGIKE